MQNKLCVVRARDRLLECQEVKLSHLQANYRKPVWFLKV